MQDFVREMMNFSVSAEPGARMTYLLALIGDQARTGDDDPVKCEKALRAAWDLYATGMFDLVQARRPEGFAYMIQRRKKMAEILPHNRIRLGYSSRVAA